MTASSRHVAALDAGEDAFTGELGRIRHLPLFPATPVDPLIVARANPRDPVRR